MAFKLFFLKQFAQLSEFMNATHEVVRCVRVDPDLKQMFIKALVKMDDDPGNPHVMISCDLPYETGERYFSGLQECLLGVYQPYAAELSTHGIHPDFPQALAQAESSGERLVNLVATLADSLPESTGSLILLLDPETVSNKDEYANSVSFLAAGTRSARAKYLVLDSRTEPLVFEPEATGDRLGVQEFYLAPEAMEEEIRADLAKPRILDQTERRQYLGLLAGFAYGRKDYAEAARLQEQWVQLAEAEGTPAELASACHNLGNSRLGLEDHQAAEDCFCRAADLCLEHDVNELLPIVLTNLGVTLYRSKQIPEAIQTLHTTRSAFLAMDQKPGEAHVLDTLAKIYQDVGLTEEAEKTWGEAIDSYQEITSDAFQDVRAAGVEDIQGKIKQLHESKEKKPVLATSSALLIANLIRSRSVDPAYGEEAIPTSESVDSARGFQPADQLDLSGRRMPDRNGMDFEPQHGAMEHRKFDRDRGDRFDHDRGDRELDREGRRDRPGRDFDRDRGFGDHEQRDGFDRDREFDRERDFDREHGDRQLDREGRGGREERDFDRGARHRDRDRGDRPDRGFDREPGDRQRGDRPGRGDREHGDGFDRDRQERDRPEGRGRDRDSRRGDRQRGDRERGDRPGRDRGERQRREGRDRDRDSRRADRDRGERPRRGDRERGERFGRDRRDRAGRPGRRDRERRDRGDRSGRLQDLLDRTDRNNRRLRDRNRRDRDRDGRGRDLWSRRFDQHTGRMRDLANDPAGALDRLRDELRDHAREHGITGDHLASIRAQLDALRDRLDSISRADGVLATLAATFAFLISIEQMLSTFVSMIPFPAFPALRITDLDVGLPHAHSHPPNLTPPNPVPVPLPSTGPVIPIPFISGASRTLINGMPAARCGDMGLGVWCGGYFPMYEVFLGSSSVWIEGARASRVAVDITKHCTFSAPKPSDPPMGPMIGFTTTASTNVMIGGVPMPSLLSLALATALKALFRGLGKVVQRLRRAHVPELPHGPAVPSAPGSAAGMRGIPSGFHPSDFTSRAQEFLDNLPRVDVDGEQMLVAGGRIDLPNGITAGELAALTNATGREFGVVVNGGRVQLVTGAADHVPVEAADNVIVHTHPDPHYTYGADISEGDVARAAQDADAHNWEHPRAVVDSEGNVHHYDRNGIVDHPDVSPIQQNGRIDGLHTSPSGAPMFAIPDGIL